MQFFDYVAGNIGNDEAIPVLARINMKFRKYRGNLRKTTRHYFWPYLGMYVNHFKTVYAFEISQWGIWIEKLGL